MDARTHLLRAMLPQQQPELLQREGRLFLVYAVYQRNPSQSVRALANSYDVAETTLRSRIRGTPAGHEIRRPDRKLQQSEEQNLVQWILDLGHRGFPPHIIDVRRTADTLLAARGQIPPPPPTGKNWVSQFINTQPKLQMKWNRKFYSQRAKCEDPVTINAWF